MIYDSLDHIDVYKHVHPGVYKGLRILRDTDFSQLPDGKYEVDGEELFYSLMTYQSKPVNDTPETHEKYIDIQCVLSGGEAMAVAPLEEMEEVVEARPEGDIWLHRGPVDGRVLLAGDRFAVLWPEDAHAPGIAVDGTPEPCRKCVVKVRVEA